MSESTQFLTPVGRLVQGSLFEPQTKDGMGNLLTVKHGPNAGQPRVEYYFAIAIPKTDPGFTELYGKMVAAAKSGFPQHFDASGNPSPNLNLKMVDGDSTVPDQKGVAPCTKEGFAGNWVIRFSSGFAPTVYDNTPKCNQILDANLVKRGYWVQVSGTVSANGTGNQPNPGIYMNHNMVRLVGHGEEIKSGPDPQQIFNAPAPLPAGASAAPMAPATAIAPPTMGAPAPAVAPGIPTAPAQPAPVGNVPVAPPVANVAPAVTAPAPAPVAPASPSSPVAPAPGILEAKYNVNGTIYTKSQLEASGWTASDIAAQTPVG